MKSIKVWDYTISFITRMMNTEESQTYEPLISILRIRKDYPIDALFTYPYAGLNELGQPQVFGKDGFKGMLTVTNSELDVDVNDIKYMGTTTPRYVMGLNNQFSLRNWDLSFLFMYYGGGVMRIEAPDPNNILNTLTPGFPEYNTPRAFEYAAREAYTNADSYVRKADYIRLRDVVLTYNLKGGFFSRIGLENTQIRVQGQNLFRYRFSGNDIDPDAIDRRSGVWFLEQQPLYSFSIYNNF